MLRISFSSSFLPFLFARSLARSPGQLRLSLAWLAYSLKPKALRPKWQMLDSGWPDIFLRSKTYEKGRLQTSNTAFKNVSDR